MTRSLSQPKINLRITAELVNTLSDGSETKVSHPDMQYRPTLTSGASANQANRGFEVSSISVPNGGQVTISLRDFQGFDIGAGAGNDGVGQEILYEEIVAIGIQNDNVVTSAGRLEIIAASSEGTNILGNHTVANGSALPGQGILVKCAPSESGFDLSASSHRITLKASGAAVLASLYILARHDDEVSSSSSSESSSSSSSSSSESSSSSSQSTSESSISTSSESSSSISTSSSSYSTSSASSFLSSESSSSQSSSSLSSQSA